MSDLFLKLMVYQDGCEPSKVSLTKKCKFHKLAVVLEQIANSCSSVSFKIGPQLYWLVSICKWNRCL